MGKKLGRYFQQKISPSWGDFTHILYNALQALHKVLGLLHREREGGEEAEDVGTCTTREDVLFLDKGGAHCLNGFLKFDTDHHALASYFYNAVELLKF